MSRHRNVRSMNYSEECEGFDDVYGHSVEDDYCVSPSVAEQFIYDRSRRPQMSAFLGQEEEIAEEDEEEEGGDEQQHSTLKVVSGGAKGLSDTDYARLQSCLEEVRNVIGDSIVEQTLIEAVLSSDFNVEKALNMVLNNATEADQLGALKAVKAEQRKDKDVFLNSFSCSSPGGSNNTCVISGSEESFMVPCVGTVDACGNSSNSQELGVLVGARVSHSSPIHLSEPERSASVSSSMPSNGERGERNEERPGCPEGSASSPKCTMPALPLLHPQLDSEEEEEEDASFPSLCSLVIHNTSATAHYAVPPACHEGLEGTGGAGGEGEGNLEWSQQTRVDSQAGGIEDDSEDSTDEFSSLCSLVVHNRSKRAPPPPKASAPFSIPPLFIKQQSKTSVGPKLAPRPQCSSYPSSEEEDDFSSLHSLVIRNRSAPSDSEVNGMLSHGQVQSQNALSTAGRSMVNTGLVSGQAVDMKDFDSEEDEEDNYSSLCSLVIHNRNANSEGTRDPPKGSLSSSSQQKASFIMTTGEWSGKDSFSLEEGRADKASGGGSFVIPPLPMVSKSQRVGSCSPLAGANDGWGGSDGNSEEEEDYVIDLCGTLKSMDVVSISSAEELESQDIPADVKHQSKVEDANEEIKWGIMEEGWVQEPVKGMILLDVDSRRLSPFGRVLCKNWECLKQLECPRKSDATTGTCTNNFLFDAESPDDICRRLRSQKYLVQVNAAKFTS